MGKFDRYMLSQLMIIFGFSSVVLVLIYWVNRAVRLFDWLIASGQSASVFLEFTALTLPNVIRVVLPISAFAATVYTTNRLTSESELVVVQSTGFGPFRMARPVLVFALIVAVLTAFLVNLAVPASFARLADRQVEIAENVTAQLLREGQFIHPDDGITLFIREITGRGELEEIYLRDARDAEQTVTYTAARALLVRTDEGPRLVMYNGIAQTLLLPERRLTVTRFDELSRDISALIAQDTGGDQARSLKELPTLDLLRADQALAEEVQATLPQLQIEGHERIAQPLMTVAIPLLGFSALLLGGFSRFGIKQQMFLSIALMISLYLMDNAIDGVVLRGDGLWPLLYTPPILGALVACAILWIAGNPQWFRRRRGAPA
ncbi:MAG: LPS export ABC transporter permease LptF [Pseudomonadota bacterium]